MTPFGPIDAPPDFIALERRALSRWQEEGLFDQVRTLREEGPPWIFYEGPPTANGRPGLHHVWARVFKDLFIRFRTMEGHQVPRKGGWDCHGLPVEIEVEKRLGFSRKAQIEEFGVREFNEMCRESVRAYVDDWRELTERAAVWIDTDDAYWTMSNDYIESVWWLVRQLSDKGLLYEGHRVTPYCPRCGTALSSHELGQPGAYRDVTDLSVYVRFPVPDDEFDLLVWTTTPWTLISNVAAAVGPSIDYVRVAVQSGRDLVMAAELAPPDAEIVDRMTGADLVGRRYRRPFDVLAIDDRGQRVVAADFVSTGDGSGIVHLAPAFGADDMEVARAQDLPVLNPVGPDGRFDDTAGRWATRSVKEADRDIADDLAARGLLVREEPYLHSYPHCWRCGTPLLYWATTSWFVRTSDRKGDLLAQNETVNWHPDHIKHGRFGDWLENNIDWALSRARYWGTPLPVWKCGYGHATCVGSLSELSVLAGRDLDGLDLHRPYVDEVEIDCPEDGCGATALRVESVLDAWFDSGSMPSAQHHHPFEPSGFASSFPADFICEAIDQTRGWFYSLLAVNVLTFGSTPYRDVVCLGHIVDEDGQKMSKSRGNVIDPWHIFDTFGSDALRWYFFSAGSPWSSRRVSENGIREASRKTLLTLWHVYSFFVTYADIEGWQPPAPSRDAADSTPGGEAPPRHVQDRWILERLDATVAAVTSGLEGFDALAASNAVASFVDDLSNWYVRRSRPRFWGSSDQVAFATLHRCLVVTSRLLAPFCPFLADELHRSLDGGRSVHLQDWPARASDGSAPLSAPMEAARRLVGLGRAARTDAGVPVRQPLRRALLLHPAMELSGEIKEEIIDELNVKALEDVSDLSELMSWTVVPNFRALGPRLGPRVAEVKAALAGASGSVLRRQLEVQGYLEVAGERLGADEVEVRAERHEDFALAHDGGWAVALDLELDEELRNEGVARELARALNDVRKKLDLAITERIVVTLGGAGARVQAAIAGHRRWIAAQVLATEIVLEEGLAGSAVDDKIEVAGESLAVEIRPAR